MPVNITQMDGFKNNIQQKDIILKVPVCAFFI